MSNLHDSRLVRALFIGCGVVALLIGVAGLFLPVLPTTPFVLVAAGCFARSSVRMHDWLLSHRIAGPIIRAWHEHRSMPPGIKPWAFMLMAFSFGLSLLAMESLWHQIMLVLLAMVLAFFLWRVPVRDC